MSFWGQVVPNYIAAVGGLAATVLAVVSLVLANRARRSDARTRSALESALVALESVASIQQAVESAVESDLEDRRRAGTRELLAEDDIRADRLQEVSARKQDEYAHALADARRKLGAFS